MAQEKQLSTIVEGKGEVPFSPKVNSSTVYDKNGQPLDTILQSVRNKIKECSSSIGEQREKIGGLQTIVDEAATIAKESSDAISQSQEYMQQLNEAIADLPDGQAVSAEVADHEIRVSGLEANSATKEEITRKYGDYSNISEFLSVTTDANDKVIEGIRKDGTKVFVGNVDAPNIRQLDSDVTLAKMQAQAATSAAQQVAEEISDVTEDIDNVSAQANSAIQQTQQLSQEVAEKYGDYQNIADFLEVKTDANDKILEGIRKDGTKVFIGDVDAPNIRQLDTDVTQAKSQAQTATATAQQASEQVASLSEDVGDAVAQAQSAAEQTQQLSQDVVEKYGDYEDVSEFLDIKTDSEERILEGTKRDGTKVFMGNVDAPNIREMNQSVEEAKASTEWFEKGQSEEWAEITTDLEGKIIKGIKADGTVYIYKLDCPELDTTITNKIIEIVGNVDKNLQLKTSYTFLPSEIRYRQGDSTIPELTRVVNNVETPITLTPVICNTQSDFDTAINSSEDVLIILNTDVIVGSVNIPANKTKFINGNGHRLIGGDVEYTATSIEGSYFKCNYTGNLTGTNLFIAPNGEVLRLARSKYYTAASRIVASDDIIDRNGSVAYEEGDNFPQAISAFTGDFAPDSQSGYHCVYHCKFQLPPELQDLEIASTDDVYINITADWMSVQTKVTKTEKTNGVNWIYFDYEQITCGLTNYIGIDNDWHIDKMYVSFFLINYKMEDNHSVLIKDSKLIFPSKYTKVYESINPMFPLQSRGVYLKLINAELVASQIVLTGEQSPVCKVLVNNCKAHGCVWEAFDIRKNSEGYFTNNEVYDCELGCFVSNVQRTKLVAMDNYIHDVGKRRNNSYAIMGCVTYYIARNKIMDFGYSAISAGIANMPKPYIDGVLPENHVPPLTEEEIDEAYANAYIESRGVIEYNEVGQTPEYFRNAQHYVVMDAGAFYITTHHAECIIRHNTICSYNGRYGNKGIYCDGGCYNIYVYSNIVANIPQSVAITQYYAVEKPYHGVIDNVNKYMLNNYVENGIIMGGRTDVEDNGCYLGANLINTRMQVRNNEISGITDTHMKNQYVIDIPSYQGVFSTSLGIQKWLNNL